MARHRPTQSPYTRPAIFTLERLHAELGGAILDNRQKYDEMSEQMRQPVNASFLTFAGKKVAAEAIIAPQ